MRFEWDPGKAVANNRKHGVAFSDALTAFDDPRALVAPDPRHSTSTEIREWLIGESDTGIMVVVFTKRRQAYRLISARRANKRERRRYEALK